MKRCCLPFELVYLVVSALFSWPLLFLLMFNSPVSKYSHLISDYDSYRHRVGELEKSSFRALDELRAWKRQFQPNHSLFDRLPAQKHKYLCVAVMSKKRIGSELNFAAQSVAALLTRTKLRLQDSILVRVFNVEQNPAQNPFLIELGDLVKVENLTAGIQNPNLRINEALDYALVMKHLTKLKCNNSLLLEDDALIANNWFSRIDSGLKYLSKRNDWAYTKLFTGYKLYDWDWVWYPSVVIKVLMLALFLHLVQYVIIHTLFPSRRLSPLSLFLLYVNCAALVVVFNATLVNPVGSGVHEYTTGFGTVSVLVPMSKSTAIADYLKNRVNGFFENREHFQAKDLLLDEFRRTNRLREFIIEPSLVQHMGIYSSVYMRDVTSEGYRRMFKSFSFLSDFDPIKFDLEYFLN